MSSIVHMKLLIVSVIMLQTTGSAASFRPIDKVHLCSQSTQLVPAAAAQWTMAFIASYLHCVSWIYLNAIEVFSHWSQELQDAFEKEMLQHSCVSGSKHKYSKADFACPHWCYLDGHRVVG